MLRSAHIIPCHDGHDVLVRCAASGSPNPGLVWLGPGGRGGVTEYILDRALGGLVTSQPPSQPRPLIMSLTRSDSKLDSELAELVTRAKARLSSSLSEVVTMRTGLAGADSLGVISQGGLWLSDGQLGLLYHATPLALIGESHQMKPKIAL